MSITTQVPVASLRRSRLHADAVRSLTAIRSHSDRVRSRATTAAAVGIGVALLIAGAVATVHDSVLTGSTVGYPTADGGSVVEEIREPAGRLAPFLAQSGLRPGVIVAAILLVLPFLALAVQALRVGRVVEDRRSRRLLTAGATWRDLRRLKVARTTAAFVRGALLAAPAYLLLWLVLGLALPPGSRLLPPPAWPLPLVWLVVIGVLWGLGHGLAASSVRTDHTAVLRCTGLPRQAPSRLFVLLFAASGVAVLCAAPVVSAAPALLPVLLIVAVVLLLIAAGAGSARVAITSETRIRAAHDDQPGDELGAGTGSPAGRRSQAWPWRRFGGRDLAVSVLSDAQRRGNALAVTGTAGVLFVCGLSFGVESALAAQFLDPQSTDSNYTGDDITFYLGGAGLAGGIGVLTAVVAIAALLLSLTDHLLGNRRAVASTAALGAETRRLVTVQARCLTRTAVPMTVLGVLVSALPYSFLFPVHGNGWSWTMLLPLAVAVIAGVLITGACRLLARALTGRVRAAADLENLRVP